MFIININTLGIQISLSISSSLGVNGFPARSLWSGYRSAKTIPNSFWFTVCYCLIRSKMNVSDFTGNTDKPPVSFCHQGSPGSLTQTLKGQFTTGETHVSITNPQSFHPAIQDTNNILLFLLLRGCTDVLCCILFILALLGYFAVGILGKTGPPLMQCEQFHYLLQK